MTHNDPNEDRETLAALNASPFNPLPWPIWLAILAIAGIEAVLWMGGMGLIGGPEGVGWRIETIQRYAFSSSLQDWMVETGRFPAMHLVRYLTFGLIHGNPMHALFVIVLVAALGKYVGEPFGNRTLLVLMIVPAVVGAAVFGLVLGADAMGWLFGGMAAVFGLVGALTWWRWQSAPDAAARWRAFGLIGVLLAARLAFGLMAEAGHAWIAELAAFAVGFAVSSVIGPGAWTRLRARLRHR